MKVLVFEPDPGGHRFTGVRNLTDGLLDLPVSVTIVTTVGARETDEYRTQLKPIEERVRLLEAPTTTGGGLRGGIKRWRALAWAIRAAEAEHVYVPYASGLAQVTGALRPLRNPVPRGVEVEGLLMRGPFAYPHRDLTSRLKAEAGVIGLMWAPFRRLHWMDSLAFDEVQRRGGSLAANSVVIPDPVAAAPSPCSPAAARGRLGIPPEGRIVGCVGVLDARKGIDLLLEAFEAASLPADHHLLLFGRCDAQIRGVLQGRFEPLVRSGRVIVRDKYVSNEELDDALLASDLVATPYPQHVGSASIAICAAAARRPVLGSDFGWCGDIIPRFGLGTTCNVSDIATFAAALAQAMRSAPDHHPTAAADRFVQFHNVSNFQAAWTKRLRERLGMPPAEFRTWEWAMRGESPRNDVPR